MSNPYAGTTPNVQKQRESKIKMININAFGQGPLYLKSYNVIPARGTTNFQTNDDRIDVFGNRNFFASYN